MYKVLIKHCNVENGFLGINKTEPIEIKLRGSGAKAAPLPETLENFYVKDNEYY